MRTLTENEIEVLQKHPEYQRRIYVMKALHHIRYADIAKEVISPSTGRNLSYARVGEIFIRIKKEVGVARLR